IQSSERSQRFQNEKSLRTRQRLALGKTAILDGRSQFSLPNARISLQNEKNLRTPQRPALATTAILDGRSQSSLSSSRISLQIKPNRSRSLTASNPADGFRNDRIYKSNEEPR